MINLESEYQRAYLEDIQTRVATAADVLDWVGDSHIIQPDEVIPPYPDDAKARASAEEAFRRHSKRVRSLVGRANNLKVNTAIHAVDWGGDNADADNLLDKIKLRDYALESCSNLHSLGITAQRAYISEKDNLPKWEVLNGYLEPLYDEEAAGAEPVGLYQVLGTKVGPVRYSVNLYDFEKKTITQWKKLSKPFELGLQGITLENQSMPRVAIYKKDQAGIPKGEIASALGLFMADLASQFKIQRVSEQHSYPILFAAGVWQDPYQLSSATILRSNDPAGKAGRIEGADLTQLFVEQDRALERLRIDLSLPISGISTRDFPSGEALDAANLAFMNICESYALHISRMMSDVSKDFAALQNISDAPGVIVRVNREAIRDKRMAEVRANFAAGFIDEVLAVSQIASFYPEWSAQDVQAHIEMFKRNREEERKAAMKPKETPFR